MYSICVSLAISTSESPDAYGQSIKVDRESFRNSPLVYYTVFIHAVVLYSDHN